MFSMTIERSFPTAVTPSPRVLRAACMFGLGVDESRPHPVVPRTQFMLPHPGVVFITGPSGGGKSTILALIDDQAHDAGLNVLCFDTMPELPEKPLVDVFDVPLERATDLLARAGLGDAFVMLRRPCELSDGQRYRLHLAQAMHLVELHGREPTVILADEFSATLDRLTARIIARNVRRWARTVPVTFVAATTHDDLLEPLDPDLLIYKDFGESLQICSRSEGDAA